MIHGPLQYPVNPTLSLFCFKDGSTEDVGYRQQRCGRGVRMLVSTKSRLKHLISEDERLMQVIEKVECLTMRQVRIMSLSDSGVQGWWRQQSVSTNGLVIGKNQKTKLNLLGVKQVLPLPGSIFVKPQHPVTRPVTLYSSFSGNTLDLSRTLLYQVCHKSHLHLHFRPQDR